MFDFFSDSLGSINSWNGEADGAEMFDPGTMPGRGGMEALEMALAPPPGTAGNNPLMGSNILGKQQTEMLPGRNNPSLPQPAQAGPALGQPGGMPGTALPVEVDEIEMRQSGGDLEQLTGGGGNQAARIGAGIGNMFKLYGGAKGWF